MSVRRMVRNLSSPMPVPGDPVGGAGPGRRSARAAPGFALVITLGLMALLLLVVVALSSSVGTETQVVQNEKDRIMARQNALVGLMAAVGELQRLSGPDQRITAPADLFAEPGDGAIDQRSWIGVWPANPPRSDGNPGTPDPVLETRDQREWDSAAGADKFSAAAGWLVSGENPDPAAGPGPDAPLFALGRGGEEVRAPRVSFGAEGENAFAFWASDESLKARVNLSDPHRDDGDPFVAGQAALVAQRFAPEAVRSDDGVPLPPESSWERITDVRQLADYGFDPEGLRDDFSVHAASVLSDTGSGGLRRDLTALARLPATGLDDGVTIDRDALPEELRDDPFLFTLADLSTETVDGSVPSNPNVGPLGSPIRGPRVEALWDFLNQGRLLDGSGGEMEVHEPATADWLAFVGGEVTDSQDHTNKMEANFALLGSRAFVEGSEREIDFFPPYEAMGLGDQLDFGSSLQLYQELVPEKHLPVNSAVTPILTELIFYVRVSIDGSPGNYELTLNAHPFAEFTNPYDVAITTGYETWWPVFNLRLSFDFRLVDDDGTLDDRIWSRENDSGDPQLMQVDGRALGSLLEALGRGGAGARVRGNASVGVFLPEGVRFDPGETKGFVADSTRGANVRLAEGENWRDVSLAIPVLDYSFDGGDVVYGEKWPSFDPDDQPDRGAGFDDYERILVRVNSVPMNRMGPQTAPLDWHTSGGSQIGDAGAFTVRMAHQTARLPFSRERIGENSAIGADVDVGDAFAAELPFLRTDGSWQNTPPQDAGVLQLRALSAEDFELGAFAVDGMNDGADLFLGRSNPRAIVLQDSHGFGGDRNFEATGWLTGFYRDPFDLALSESGWGESNVEDRPTVLFHVPRRTPLSLGMLRHWNIAYATGDPAYLVGSSRRPFADLGRDETVSFRTAAEDYRLAGDDLDEFDFSGNSLPSSVTVRRADFPFDGAYYVNRALWDSWFLSTAPDVADPSAEEWPNSRFSLLEPDGPDTVANLADIRRAAAEVLLDGGFNVNSTSERAWGAVLASRLGLDPDGTAGDADEVFFPRRPGMAEGGDEWSRTPAIDADDIFDPDQIGVDSIGTLSKRIVREVRERGPFLSIAHFVNRLLVDDERGERGALQAAIEGSGINAGKVFPYAPGSVIQGDVLQSIGPVLAARGDTFVVRAMGEAVDPAGGTGAEAWCEATLQRVPDWVNPVDPPEARPAEGGLDPANERFGRAYRVVAFQWIEAPE